MSVTTTRRPGASANKEEQPYVDPVGKRNTGRKLLVVAAVWVLLWVLLRGHQTLALDTQDTTGFHQWLDRVRDWVQLNGPNNWFFHGVLGNIGSAFNSVVSGLQGLISTAAYPAVIPTIGWLGVVAIVGWVAYAVAGLRYAVVGIVTLVLFGLFGLWSVSIDTLIVTLFAVVISLVIGLPIGIAMARSTRVSTFVTPVLDIMQTMPAFAYLTPMALFFGIGPACAVVLTLIYSLPPLIRITEHGVRSVSGNTIEAARSLGLTSSQMLRRVQLPMARRTIVVGINQCTMAALSMTTIAALVNGPGLGKPVLAALQTLDVGAASVAGLAIVLMAIMLDRTTTAASERSESTSRAGVASVSGPGVTLNRVILERLPRWATEDAGRGARAPRLTPAGRRLTLGLLLIPVAIAIYLSRTYGQLAVFGVTRDVPGINIDWGPQLASGINSFTDSFVNAVDVVTNGFKNGISYGFLNPLQSLMAQSPWWVMAIVLLAFAYFLGGWKPAVITAVCEAVILGTGLWNDSMVTLTMTLVATVLVMVLAAVIGVAMGRSRRADLVIRPVLDGLQTIPAFVYLVPALALFASSRFTAIVAAMAYAVPISTKLVADGIRGVSPTTVEAVRSTGSSSWQMITKVQLPMAREALVLATNQGLLYVLSMVVVGGMVGGGSLGFLVVSGFVQDQLFGKGLAAGIAITALGVMLDRIARYAAARYGR